MMKHLLWNDPTFDTEFKQLNADDGQEFTVGDSGVVYLKSTDPSAYVYRAFAPSAWYSVW